LEVIVQITECCSGLGRRLQVRLNRLLEENKGNFLSKKQDKIKDARVDIDDKVGHIQSHLERLFNENQADFTKFYELKIREICRIFEYEHRKKSIKVA
jgi:hypothetical protein